MLHSYIFVLIFFITFCGHQGIVLRGHRDSEFLNTHEPLINKGNFRELLKYFFKATSSSDDESYKLAHHNYSKNAQYIS